MSSFASSKGSLQKPYPPVSLSAFALLFRELVHYYHGRVNRVGDLTDKLSEAGKQVGYRALEYTAFRQRPGVSPWWQSQESSRGIVGMLSFIKDIVWKSLFGKPADNLQKSVERANEYMIHDNDPLVNRFISVPEEMGSLDCAAFMAGIIDGVLEASGFPATEVRAVPVALEDGTQKCKTVFVINFGEDVVRLDNMISAKAGQ
jgi:trafficking protein particle complex subunit 5|eukprot:g5642.t1